MFQYLGCMLSMHDDDTHVVRTHLAKAHSCWNWVALNLNGENASLCVCGKFWKAVMQSVLLYCSKTWVLTPTLLERLEGIQLRCTYQMAKWLKPQWGPGGSWVYPRSDNVLEECGLFQMEEYVWRRRQTIVPYVVDQPILAA